MKIIITMAMALITFGTFAQKSTVSTAVLQFRDGELDKAKENIDKAILNESTKNDAKAWFNRGLIYQSLFESQNPDFVSLKENALIISGVSYQKALNFDTKKKYTEDAMKYASILRIQSLNEGVKNFGDGKYEEAGNLFKSAINVGKMLGITDSLGIYNTGLAADRAGNDDEAVEYYQMAADIGYGGPNVYSYIAQIHQKQGNIDLYLKAIGEGRVKFPNDQGLIITELNYYLKEGKFEEAKKNLELAIEKDPTNPVLGFALGSVYDNLGKVAEAETAYKQSLAVDADYFDANYNLGALYFNNGVKINDAAADISDNAKYEVEKAKANDEFKKAIPFLEKALELEPTDANTISSLKQLYVRMGMTEKYNALNKK